MGVWVFLLFGVLPVLGGSVSAPTPIVITASAGSTAVLPCDWSHESSALSSSESPHVLWRISSEVVFERHQQEMFQGEGYEGRVDVPEDQLLKGNCSLVLKNIRREDTGTYQSYQLKNQTKSSVQSKRISLQRVELYVLEKSEMNKSASNNPSNGERSDSSGVNGVIIGAVVVVLVAVVCGFIVYKQREKRRRNKTPPQFPPSTGEKIPLRSVENSDTFLQIPDPLMKLNGSPLEKKDSSDSGRGSDGKSSDSSLDSGSCVRNKTDEDTEMVEKEQQEEE